MDLIELDKPVENMVSISEDRIRSTDDIAKAPTVLKIDGIPKFTKGNISAWQGIAKSKKTFAITLTVGGLVAGESIHNKFAPEGDGNLAWFDTEQSPFDAQKVVRRLKKLAGVEERLHFYALRRYGAKTRVQKIEAYLAEYGKDLDFMVIDGVRDLVIDFNDPVESSEIVTKLMAWTIDYDCHISVVLHANKGDGNMRGHLGTELENKCEAAFSVTKDEINTDMSEVEEKFGRGKNIEKFKIVIDGNGMPGVYEGDGDYDTGDSPF